MKTGTTKASTNRDAQRAALRQRLSKEGHLQHVSDLLGKLSDLDQEISSIDLQRISKVIDTKLKLVNKYLPDDREPTDLNLGSQEIKPVVNVFLGSKEDE